MFLDFLIVVLIGLKIVQLCYLQNIEMEVCASRELLEDANRMLKKLVPKEETNELHEFVENLNPEQKQVVQEYVAQGDDSVELRNQVDKVLWPKRTEEELDKQASLDVGIPIGTVAEKTRTRKGKNKS